MLDDVHPPESPSDAINNAESVLPILEATKKVSKEEMRKLMDQVEGSLDKIGPYATVFTHADNKGDFVILNQPVDVPGGDRKGMVILTEDGFMSYKRQDNNTLMKTDDDLWMFPGLVVEATKAGGSEMRYFLFDGKPQLYNSKSSAKVPLDFLDSDEVVVKAINTSISKAQEGPKQTITRNQATIAATGVVQAAIAGATIK